jgi:uncharacterized protein (TIGR00369 family)
MTDDLQATLIAMFQAAPISGALRFTLEYDAQGAVVRLPRNPQFDHGGGDVHGGILATLLAMAGWFTAAAACRTAVVTSDIHVRFLRPAKQQDLTAHGRIIRQGSKLTVVEMKVVGADPEVIATATASFVASAGFGKGPHAGS